MSQPDLPDRYRGAPLGLACGDALGTAVEFSARGTFASLTDMRGGGPFRLAPGQWTDDTSMALCLAESLIEKRGFDARKLDSGRLVHGRRGMSFALARPLCLAAGIAAASAPARARKPFIEHRPDRSLTVCMLYA